MAVPKPSLNGGIRLHQQGSIRVPRSACGTATPSAGGKVDEAGCLLQAASVLWGGMDAKRTESLVLFASLDEGDTFTFHATVA